VLRFLAFQYIKIQTKCSDFKCYHLSLKEQCHEIFDSDPTVSMTPLNSLPWSHCEYGICYKNVQVGSLRTRNPNFAKDYLDFLGEYEAICEKALARESGP
jgi:hypothetical protein